MKSTELTKQKDVNSSPERGSFEVIDLSQASTLNQLVNAVKKTINRTVDQGSNVLITGPAGSGKTTLGRALGDHTVQLDRFGSLKSGKWFIDVNRLSTQFHSPSRQNIFVGISDNMLEVLRALKPVTVFVLHPSVYHFSMVMNQRAKSEEAFADLWHQRASWTQEDIDSEIDRLLKDLRSMMVPSVKVLKIPTLDDVEITGRGEKINVAQLIANDEKTNTDEKPIVKKEDKAEFEVTEMEFNTALLLHGKRLKGADDVWSSDIERACILVDGYTYADLFSSKQLPDVINLCNQHNRVSIHAVTGSFDGLEWDWKEVVTADDFNDPWVYMDDNKFIAVAGSSHYDPEGWVDKLRQKREEEKIKTDQ